MSTSSAVDVLAFGAHPDDVELFCGGTVCSLVEQGYSVAIVDLTRGELGSRGSAAMRSEEASAAATLAGVATRENLGLPDGDICNTFDNRIKVIRSIRKFRPQIVITNAPECRHPDHGAASHLIEASLFYSGLRRIETYSDGELQEAWRPAHHLQYVQAVPFDPDIVVDVSSVWDKRLNVVKAFASQFHHPDYKPSADEPETFISSSAFFESIEAKARMQGQRIGVEFGEGFRYVGGPIGAGDLVSFVAG